MKAFDKDAERIMQLLPRLVAEGSRVTDAFASRHSLHRTDAEALSLLMLADTQGDVLTTGALGAQLGLTSGATTFAVNRLEAAGLVQRRRDESDQRRILLHLSDLGRSLSADVYLPVATSSIDVLSGFSPDETETIGRFLTEAIAAVIAYRQMLENGGDA